MSERRSKGCIIAALIWCVILALLGVTYRFVIHPRLKGKLKEATSAASQYRDEIILAADSFSGYCVLRSEELKQELKSRQIKLVVRDDQADYAGRLAALRSGEVQMAVFTIDSLLMAGAKAGDFPATIVFVLDETKGGDAVVAHRSALASLQDLNNPGARIVVTPNSPSEFLARVVLAHFSLPSLSDQWMVPANGASEVFQRLRSAAPTEKKAFVLWEPYVSRALQEKGVHVLLDSSKLEGYIVDILVAQRQFLLDRPDLVQAVVEGYARAAYSAAQKPAGMVQLVLDDARQTGAETLDEPQARKIVQGIHWKNLLENYAHFGLSGPSAPSGLPSLEDMIGNIMDVLLKTKALPADPLSGQYYTLFYDKILAELKAAQFHPGRGINLLPGVGPEDKPETIRQEQDLPALTGEQWTSLRPVGELRVAPIAFTRGSAALTLDGERELQDLARRLQTFPRFYVRVIGHSRAEGDPEANRQLAQARADASSRALIGQGITPQRIRAETAPPGQSDGAAQAVSFSVGQVPY